MNEKVTHWLNIADYDMETAHAMLQTKRYLYVGFMCQQVIEKALKAVIAAKDTTPPKIHRLRKLAELSNIYETLTDGQQDLLNTLSSLYLNSRYEQQKLELAASLSPDKCEKILSETEDLLCWIKQQL